MTQIGRPSDIEEWSNRYFIHRASERLLPILIRLKLTPNTVSFLGLFSAIIAAYLYYLSLGGRPLLGLAGLGFAIFWHILDGSDGKLARATGRASEYGRIIDGICDHSAFAAIYFVLTIRALDQGVPPTLAWPLAITAALAHAYQAASFERRRQSFAHIANMTLATNEKAPEPTGFMSILSRLYSKIQTMGQGGLPQIEIVMAEAIQQSNQEKRDTALKIYNDLLPNHIRRWSILSANHRTIAIFVFVLIGFPLGYFLFEILFLTLLHFNLLRAEKRISETLAATTSFQ
ncbi:MAG: CDP-alcohol phosphatidyltransferase family protein [Sphingomonadales bacterium]|jgi:phosphatidylglycerophosphate synthase